MPNEIDRIDIVVSATGADSAAKGLQAVDRALTRLKKIADKLAPSLTALERLDGVSNAIERLSQVGDGAGLNNLISTLNRFARIKPDGMKNLAEAANAFSPEAAGRIVAFSESIKTLTDSVAGDAFNRAYRNLVKLSKIDLSNLTVNASGLMGLMNTPKTAPAPAPATPKTPEVTPLVSGMTDMTSQIEKGAPEAIRKTKELKTAVQETGNEAVKAGAKAREAAEQTGKSASKLQTFFASLKRIAFYRLIRGILRGITEGVKEGVDNLYQYSKAFNGTFSQAMDSIATSSQYLKNSFATAVAPLIEELAPVIELIVNGIADAIDKVNQFVAILRGASSWTRAVRVQKEYAAAVEDTNTAVKELKKTVLGFDELNLLNDPTSSSSKKGKTIPDFGSMFEEVPIDQASEGVKAFAEKVLAIIDKIKAGIEKIKELMDFLGIDMEDILTAAGVVAGVLLTWKFAQGFLGGLDALKGLLNALKVTTGLVVSIAGFALEFSAMKDLGRGEVTLENILKAALGASAGILGLTIAFGPTGLVLGLVATVAIAIAGLTIGRQQAMWETELGQRLKAVKDEIEKNHTLAIEIQTEINVHREDVAKKIRDIETEFDGLRAMLDEIFRLDAKDNKTAAELDTLKRLAKELNDYGIEIHIDEAGHVVETREELEKLIDKTEAYYKLQAYQEGLIQAYKDQAKAELALRDAQDLLNISSGNYRDAQQKVFDALSDSERKTRNIKDATDIYGTTLGNLIVTSSNLNLKAQELIPLLVESRQEYDTNKDSVKKLEAALEDVTKDIDFYSGKIDEANQKELVTSTDNTELDETLNKIGSVPSLVNTANSVKLKIQTDDSAVRDLENRIAALGSTSKNIAQRMGNGPTISAYASGGTPETGELFLAREAGAELVGSIGRRTTVANNDQIVEGISVGVRDANEEVVNALYAAASQIVRAVDAKDTAAYIDGRKISKEVTTGQNRMNRMYGATLQNA